MGWRADSICEGFSRLVRSSLFFLLFHKTCSLILYLFDSEDHDVASVIDFFGFEPKHRVDDFGHLTIDFVDILPCIYCLE